MMMMAQLQFPFAGLGGMCNMQIIVVDSEMDERSMRRKKKRNAPTTATVKTSKGHRYRRIFIAFCVLRCKKRFVSMCLFEFWRMSTELTSINTHTGTKCTLFAVCGLLRQRRRWNVNRIFLTIRLFSFHGHLTMKMKTFRCNDFLNFYFAMHLKRRHHHHHHRRPSDIDLVLQLKCTFSSKFI